MTPDPPPDDDGRRNDWAAAEALARLLHHEHPEHVDGARVAVYQDLRARRMRYRWQVMMQRDEQQRVRDDAEES